MLFYRRSTAEDLPNEPWHTWWLGMPVPAHDVRIMEFQADGDELALLLEAMKNATKQNNEVKP
jgi:hypothetical protein